MCASECVCLHLCVLGGYKGEEGGQEKEQNFLFCVVLCSLVLLGGRAQQNGRTQIICLAFPPSVPSYTPLVPSLTYRTLLNGKKWLRG